MKNTKTIKVSFDAAGGKLDIDSLIYRTGEKFGQMPRPERKGYVFDGWYTAPSSEAQTKMTSSDTVEFDSDTTLYAHWVAATKKRKRSMYRIQRRAIVVVAAILVALIIALPIVNYFVGRSVYRDDDGRKYYIEKKDGVYAMYDEDGIILPTTPDGFYSTVYGTLLKVDEEDGEMTKVGIVDTDNASGEKLDYSTVRFLMFPTLSQSNIAKIEITNDHGTLKFKADANEVFYIEGKEAYTYVDDTYYIMCARLANACGYTLAKEKLLSPIKDENGLFTEYGLAPCVRENEDGEEYDYIPAKYTITDKTGKSHTVIVGDEIPSGGGYYCQYEGRDAVYMLGTDMSIVKDPIEKFLSPAIIYPTSYSNYYNVENFMLIKFDYSKFEQTGNRDDIISDPKICFSFIPLEDRENTLYSTAAFEILSTNLDKYQPNSDNMLNVLQAFCNMEYVGICEFGVSQAEDDVLEKYGLLDPAYSITFRQNDITYGSDKKYSANNTLLISEINEAGNYYVLSTVWDMIVEIDGDYFEFLNWTPIKWIDLKYYQINLAYLDKLQFTTPELDKVFTFNNSESDHTNGASSSDIKIFLDKEQFLDVDNFRELYKVILFGSIEGEATDTLTEEEIEALKADLSKVQLTIKYQAEDFTGDFEERTIRFYRYSEGRSLITIDDQGIFCVKSSYVEKIVSDINRLLAGEKIDYDAKY